MTYKSFLTVAWLLLCISTYAQHTTNAYNPYPVGSGEKISTTPGLVGLVQKDDDMTGKVLYYDSRTSIHNLRGNGIYATIIKYNGRYNLNFVAYHAVAGAVVINGFGSSGEKPEDVTGVLIKTTDTLFTFENPTSIMGNGSALPHISVEGITMDKNNFAYKVLSRIIKGNYAKLRFEASPGINDYVLTDREISEIKNVVNAWLAVNNIQ